MLYAIVAVLILIVDQWLKYWVSANIALEEGAKTIIPSVVDLVNVHNNGAAFSMLSGGGMRWVFVIIAIAIVVALIVLMAKQVLKGNFARWCAVLAIAGALGNCIDRIMFGYVVDMFQLRFVSFAVFNVADIVLVVACLLFIIYLFVGEKEETEDEEEEEQEEIEAVSGKDIKKAKKSRREKKEEAEDEEEVTIVVAEEKEEIPEPAAIKTEEKKAPAAEKDSMDFDLEDILAEFR